MSINNPYDKDFEAWLVHKGYDLDTISLNESLKLLKEFNRIINNL